MYECEAKALWDARVSGGTVPLDQLSGIGDVAAGYAAQAVQIDLSGETIGGYKLGATSKASQDLMGLEEPFTGPIYRSAILNEGADFGLSGRQLNFAEAELAFHLSGPIPAGSKPDQIRAAIASVHAALEIACLRFEGGPAGQGRFFIADNGVNGAIILGPALPISVIDQADLTVTLDHGGAEPAQGGYRSLVWDHPLDALVWLADRQHALARPLAAGDVIMTGSISGMAAITPGARLCAHYGDHGSVTASTSVR